MMTLRTIAERLARGRSFIRKLPEEFNEAKIVVSPDSQLKYLKPGLDGFDPELLRIAKRFVKPNTVVWDVGANVGVFAFASAALGGNVLAIEPDPFLVSLLIRSMEINDFQSVQVKVLGAAISDRNGFTELLIAQRGRASNALAEAKGSDQMGGVRSTRSVPTLRLDSLIETAPAPEFVKIDIEGAEILALDGASRLLRDVRPSIYLEVNKRNVAAATKILRDAGYRLFMPNSTSDEIEVCAFNTVALPI